MTDLPDVVGEFGLPSHDAAEEYEGYWRRPFEVFIEVQVWSNAPLKSYLAANNGPTLARLV